MKMVAAKILDSTCLTPSYLTQFLPSYNSLQILSTTIIVSWCSGKIDLNSTKIYTNNLWMSLHIFMSSVFTIEDPNFMVTSILSLGSLPQICKCMYRVYADPNFTYYHVTNFCLPTYPIMFNFIPSSKGGNINTLYAIYLDSKSIFK